MGDEKAWDWSVWGEEPSEFDWAYTDEELCYIIEGKAEIAAADERVVVEKGDYVVFPRGLTCRWKVSERIKKFFHFSSPVSFS